MNGSIVGGSPSYLIIGGMVLVSLGLEYLHTEFETDHMGDYEQWGDEFKLLALAQESKTKDVEEVVLLSQVISHSCNIGYETYRNLHLESFNGRRCCSMRHLKALVTRPCRGWSGEEQAGTRSSLWSLPMARSLCWTRRLR